MTCSFLGFENQAYPYRRLIIRQVYLVPTEPLLRKIATMYRTYSYIMQPIIISLTMLGTCTVHVPYFPNLLRSGTYYLAIIYARPGGAQQRVQALSLGARWATSEGHPLSISLSISPSLSVYIYIYIYTLSGTRKRPRRFFFIVFSNNIPDFIKVLNDDSFFVFSNEENVFLSFSRNIQESFVGPE